MEAYWPGLFAKALDGVDIKELCANVGSGAGSGGAAPAAAAAGDAPAEEGKNNIISITRSVSESLLAVVN